MFARVSLMDGVSASTPAGLTPRCLTSESECLHARDIFQRCGVATRWKIPAIKQKNNGNNQTAMKNNAAAGGHLRGRSCHPMRGKIFSLPFASATVLQGRQPETEKILPRRVVRKTKPRPINSWCARTTVPHGHLLKRSRCAGRARNQHGSWGCCRSCSVSGRRSVSLR